MYTNHHECVYICAQLYAHLFEEKYNQAYFEQEKAATLMNLTLIIKEMKSCNFMTNTFGLIKKSVHTSSIKRNIENLSLIREICVLIGAL